MIINIFKFLNDYQGAIISLLTLSMVIATIFYVRLTKKLADCSMTTIKQLESANEKETIKNEVIHRNIVMLLNGELYMNSYYYAFTMYYLLNNNLPWKERFNLFRTNNVYSIEKTSKAQMVSFPTTETWDKISSECIYYLSNELNQELVGYYAGIKYSKIFSINGMTKESFLEFAKGQLISTYKCFKLFDEEVLELRRDNIYEINDKRFVINAITGDLLEVKE